MALNDQWQVNWEFICPGMPDPGITGFQLEMVSNPNPQPEISEGPLLCIAIQTVAEALFQALVPTTGTVLQLRVRNLSQVQFGGDLAIGLVGTRALAGAAILPPQNSAVASFRTGLIGRSYRGRGYMPPVGEVDWEGVTGWSAAYIQDIVDYFDAVRSFTEVASGGTYNHVVWSATLNTASTVNDILVDPLAGSQDRRKT